MKHPLQMAFERNLKFLNQETYDISFFQNLFCKTEKMEIITVGEVDFPTGNVILADPMVYLGNEKYQTALEKQIPKGSYDVELAMIRSAMAGVRVAAARLKISNQIALRYEIAMPKGFELADLQKPGVFSFFGVDAGLACLDVYKRQNLHCAIVGVNLFDNFKFILKTTIPSYIISLILCAIVGMKYAPSGETGMNSIEIITSTLDALSLIHIYFLL